MTIEEGPRPERIVPQGAALRPDRWPDSAKQTRSAPDWLLDRLARGLIGCALALPLRWRVRGIGLLMQHVIGRVSGFRRRAITQLRFIWPDMPEERARELAAQVLNNVGRTLIENYGTKSLLARAKRWPVEGPGLAALDEAAKAGRPALLITGHFGNYEAARAALVARGFNPGGLYRPLNNGFSNDHYVKTMEGFGGPVFPRGREGLKGLLRFLKGGGQVVMLIDQYYGDGEFVDFMGQPALTSPAAAEMALKYDAVLIPFYGTRAANGLDFTVTLEAPIAPSTPLAMTQALTDSLAARVRRDPGQWFWVHRRWKPERWQASPARQAKLAEWQSLREAEARKPPS